MNTAFHSFTVTPVVSFPHDRVIVYPSLPAALIAFRTFSRAVSDFSSSSPSPATFTILKRLKTGCFFINALSALPSLMPGIIHSECLNKSRYSFDEYGYLLYSSSFAIRQRKLQTSFSWTKSPIFAFSGTGLKSLHISPVHTRKNSWKLKALSSSSTYLLPSSLPRS